jgi:hypothetical protein
VAVLPLDEPAGPVVQAMQATGLWKKAHRLEPAELLNRDQFNAKRYPVLLNVDGENYMGTVRREGDAAEGILDYLRSGGMLVMLCTQPLPFCYDGLGRGHSSRPLTPRMGMPINITFEKPPERAGLKMVFNPGQKVLRGMPAEIPFPTEGDLRLRSIQRARVSGDAEYAPILTVVGQDGKDYGDAAAIARFRRGPFAGARLVYVWSRLLADKDLGPEIIGQTIRFVCETSKQ